MSAVFPSPEWLEEFKQKLNTDEQYGRVAKNWEGDFVFVIEPDGNQKEPIYYYLDLWHGKCRSAVALADPSEKEAAFVMSAPYGNFTRVVLGKLDPMQAMMTRKLQLKGNMAYLMRNIPVVLNFVCCCQEVTSSIK